MADPSSASAPRGRVLALAGPSIALAAVGPPLTLYLPEYFASHIGLPLASVGAAFMIVRLADIALDPILGEVMDRTNSRFGRFRPWFALGAPLLMVACAMMYLAPVGVGMTYMVGGLALIYAAQSICLLAQNAWASRLSDGYEERSRIFAWNQAAGLAGMVLILILPSIMALQFPSRPERGVQAIGWFSIILMPAFTLLTLLRVPEPSARKATPSSAFRIEDLIALIARPNVARLLGADLLLGLNLGLTGSLFIFYITSVLELTRAQANLSLLVYFSVGLAGAPFWTRLANIAEKHRALAFAAAWTAASQAALLLYPAKHFLLILPGVAFGGIAYIGGPFLLRSLMADVGDEVRLAKGADRTGMLYALVNTTSKVGQAIAVGLGYMALSAFGYRAGLGHHNTASALVGLRYVFVGGSVALTLGAASLAWRHTLTRRSYGAIRKALRDLDAGSPAPPAT